jgi:hypothetical protein
VAAHLRAIFSTPDWLSKHSHMKINEIVVMYIDKDEIQWPPTDPKYTVVKDISKKYSFLMQGRGRVAGRRFSCWDEACCLAHENGEGLTPAARHPTVQASPP